MCIRDRYDPFEDAPQEGEFDWGGFARNLVMGLAVGAACIALAVFLPEMCIRDSLMYCMPQKGTKTALYIGNGDEAQGIATGCIRTNGSTCEGTGSPEKKSFRSEHGKGMDLYPQDVYKRQEYGRQNAISRHCQSYIRYLSITR